MYHEIQAAECIMKYKQLECAMRPNHSKSIHLYHKAYPSHLHLYIMAHLSNLQLVSHGTLKPHVSHAALKSLVSHGTFKPLASNDILMAPVCYGESSNLYLKMCLRHLYLIMNTGRSCGVSGGKGGDWCTGKGGGSGSNRHRDGGQVWGAPPLGRAREIGRRGEVSTPPQHPTC